MTYIFDENTSPFLVGFLNHIGARDVCHLFSKFERGTLDPDLLPVIAREGLILVTNDQAMRKDHRDVLTQSGNRVIFLPPAWDDLGKWGQAEFIIRRWRQIETQVRNNRSYVMMRLNKRGDLTNVI